MDGPDTTRLHGIKLTRNPLHKAETAVLWRVGDATKCAVLSNNKVLSNSPRSLVVQTVSKQIRYSNMKISQKFILHKNIVFRTCFQY